MGSLAYFVVFSMFYLHALSMSQQTRKISTIKYVITADAKPGPIGKIPQQVGVSASFQIRPSSKSRYRKRGQDLISVDRNTGVISLKKQPKRLFRFARNNGIRELNFQIVSQSKSSRIVSTDVKLRLVILRVAYGDRFLKDVGEKISRGNLVRKSQTFRNPRNALHRFLRIIAQRADPVGFGRAFSAIKEEKGVTFANVDVVRRTEKGKLKPGTQREYLIFKTNSLYSTNALNRLKNDAGCEVPTNLKCPTNDKFRTIDGSCNNRKNPLLGSAPRAFNRLVPARYFDSEGLNDPIGFPDQPLAPDVPSPFEVVRDFIIKQDNPGMNDDFSHAVMQWGQWLDHDFDLTPESESSDNCQEVPCDGSREDFFPPCFTIEPIPGFDCIRFARSAVADCQVKNGRLTVREQLNVNTAYVDGSQVYGSTDTLARELRDLSSRGLLRVEPGINGDFLPTDDSELVAPDSFCRDTLFGRCFLAGDSRVSEQQVLATMHTLFVREHNRIAKELGKLHSSWDGEKIYQQARRIVGAVLQKITYYDYLPIIIGNTLPEYRGYNPKVNPDVLNSFATAAYRFGHSTIRPAFDILDGNFEPVGNPLPLGTLFFNNTFIIKNGIDPLLLGLLKNASETVDRKLATPLLDELFARPNSPALNLAALNIQRGRDHGLPGYNAFRRYCGFKDAKNFLKDTKREIPSKLNRKLLAKLYNDDPELADLWPAGLAEAPANGGIVGATFGCIIREQLRRARDGDRFFYNNTDYFSEEEIKEVEKATFSRILCDNLQIIVSVQRNAFIAGNRGHPRVACERIPGMNLSVFGKEIHDPCNPNPCLNSGKCIRRGKRRFKCSCRYGYFGYKCNSRHPPPRKCRWIRVRGKWFKKCFRSGKRMSRKHF